MTLVAKVLRRGELQVDALGLKNYANFAPQQTWFPSRIVPEDESTAPDRNHQCGENAKHCRLPTTVRAKQAKQFRRTNVERHSVQGGAIAITVHYLAHDDG